MWIVVLGTLVVVGLLATSGSAASKTTPEGTSKVPPTPPVFDASPLVPKSISNKPSAALLSQLEPGRLFNAFLERMSDVGVSSVDEFSHALLANFEYENEVYGGLISAKFRSVLQYGKNWAGGPLPPDGTSYLIPKEYVWGVYKKGEALQTASPPT
jgi:hypothetical protein